MIWNRNHIGVRNINLLILCGSPTVHLQRSRGVVHFIQTDDFRSYPVNLRSIFLWAELANGYPTADWQIHFVEQQYDIYRVGLINFEPNRIG